MLFFIEDLILFKIFREVCFEIIIFEFNNDDVFSYIILSIVWAFFGSQSRWSSPIGVIILARFFFKIFVASNLWNKPVSINVILFKYFLAP